MLRKILERAISRNDLQWWHLRCHTGLAKKVGNTQAQRYLALGNGITRDQAASRVSLLPPPLCSTHPFMGQPIRLAPYPSRLVLS